MPSGELKPPEQELSQSPWSKHVSFPAELPELSGRVVISASVKAVQKRSGMDV